MAGPRSRSRLPRHLSRKSPRPAFRVRRSGSRAQDPWFPAAGAVCPPSLPVPFTAIPVITMRSLPFPRPGAPVHALLRLALAAVLALAAAACKDGTGAGNPTPAITHLEPGTLLQWSDTLAITVTGGGFVDGAVVRVNGTPRLTTYVSPSQLTALIPAEQMVEAGTLQVTVFNPKPRGGESEARPLVVEHRVPDVQSIQPSGITVGSADFTLRVNGAGFAQGSVIRWNGADRPTTFVHAGQVTAQIPAADVAAAGTAQVTVFNPAPGGGTSVARVFTTSVRPNPRPVVTALAPATIQAETGATFTVTGSNFMAGSQVRVGGFSPTTTFVSATQLRFSLEGSNVPNAGVADVMVINPAPGGGVSNAVQLRVDNPAPVLTGISPAQGLVGADSVVVRLAGTGFVAGSTVRVNGTNRLSRRLSPTELEIVLAAIDVNSIRTFSFQVANASPGGGISNTLTLPLVYPVPTLATLTPAHALAGQDSLVVRVTGTGFVLGTAVHFAGAARRTVLTGHTSLEAVLVAEDLDEAGTFPITAVNPGPGGGASAPVSLTLAAPPPEIRMLSSTGATAGRQGFSLAVHGSGFIRTSVVRWSGAARHTRFISSTQLEADILHTDVELPGTAYITVHTPGAGTTPPREITRRTLGAASLTGVRSLPLPARDIVYDAMRDRIYASLDSTAGPRANTVVAIDPGTGEVTGSASVGAQPGVLALSDDGTTLWVAVNGTRQVRRLALPSLTPGTAFSIGDGPVEVGDMKVMPNRAGTVAVSLRSTCCTPRYEGVAIYDDGVRRPRTEEGHTGPNTIAFDETGALLYGLSNEGTGAFYTLRVQPDGVAVARQTPDLLSGAYDRMQYAGGRAYSFGAPIVDATRHWEIGRFVGIGTPTSMTLDTWTGRAFYVDLSSGRDLKVLDINTFLLLGSIPLPVGESQHPALTTERLVRWGTDGLALSDGRQIHLLRTPLAAR